MPDLEIVDNLTQLSPPAALAVALWFVGTAIKKSPLAAWLIPFILPLLGAILFPFIADTAKVSYSVRSPMVFNAVIGLCIGGASVALDNMIYQWLNRSQTSEGKTAVLKKSETVITEPKL